MDVGLLYIHYVGQNWRGENVYQFLFTDNLEDADGEDWDAIPAAGKPLPPNKDFVVDSGLLVTDLKFELLQNSTERTYWDGVDKLIALGSEDMTDYEDYPEKRLGFMFGETIKSVTDALYAHDLTLKMNKDGQEIFTV
jgi:hypothetical protein